MPSFGDWKDGKSGDDEELLNYDDAAQMYFMATCVFCIVFPWTLQRISASIWGEKFIMIPKEMDSQLTKFQPSPNFQGPDHWSKYGDDERNLVNKKFYTVNPKETLPIRYQERGIGSQQHLPQRTIQGLYWDILEGKVSNQGGGDMGAKKRLLQFQCERIKNKNWTWE